MTTTLSPALCTASMLCALLVSCATSATVVTPGGYENASGVSDNCIPFTCQQVDHYQQVYDASGFAGVTGIVSSAAFRLDNIDSIPSGGFEPPINNGSFTLQLDLLVTLSHSSVTSQTISNELIAPGPDARVVLDGVVNWNAIQYPGDGLNPFDLRLDFLDLFAYDGTQSLLLDIVIRNADSIATQVAPRYLDAAGFPPGSGPAPFARVWTAPNVGTGFNVGYGLVTQFEFVQPVPLPAPIMMFASSLLPLAWMRRRYC